MEGSLQLILSLHQEEGRKEVKMHFCSHLLCHFNLRDNLEIPALENTEISD